MIVLRRLAVATLFLAAVAVVPVSPASAHGSLTNPISRVAACGPEGGERAGSAACRAAISANGTSFQDWDNLRLPDVAGKDRQVVPDGKLCSAGIDRYKGLDLARADWPATRVRAGADFTFTYRGTIPHKGTFRMYVTKTGYSPTRPLRWSDLGTKPFLSVTDPVMRNDSYVIKGKLPQGRKGRHLIYTVWQNSDTPDTYYACSDVVFDAASAGSGSGTAGSTRGAAQPAGAADEAAPELIPVAVDRGTAYWPMTAGAVVVVATAVLVAALFLRRRRPTGTHRRRG